jgi:hypothetical protein
VRGRRSSPFTRSTLVAGLHLAALSSIAIAQPLFDLLGRNADFFAAHNSGTWDVLVFAFAITVVPPLALLMVEVVAGLVDERLRALLHYLFVGGLVALFVIQAVKKRTGLPSSRWVLCVVLAGALASLAYWRLRPARLFVGVLAPAPVLFLVLFLFFSPVEKFVLPAHPEAKAARNVAANVPVVVVIFDEFPITSLMDASHQIDEARYPNFAALARDSTWFRSETTVHEGTAGAVPAIMTGIYPHRHTFPIFADHPNNLFTLLGSRYKIVAFEPITHLCPPKLCRNPVLEESFSNRLSTLVSDSGVVYAHLVVPDDYDARIPSVSSSWGNFRTNAEREQRGRVHSFDRFVDFIKRTHRPTLDLIHIEVPHVPWVLLPSCHVYGDALRVASAVRGRDTWIPSGWLVVQAFQRHLLQVQCTDRLLGRLLARMREQHVYDRSLLIVTADHGVSLRPGDHRRAVSATNVGDIAFPPLFVKRPGQHTAEVVDRHVQSIDIVPTIADVLGIKIPWHVDGVSVFRPSHLTRIHLRTAHGTLRTPVAPLLRLREDTLRRQIALFGSGAGGPGLYGIGPHPELIGQRVKRLQVGGRLPGTNASVSQALAGTLRRFAPGVDDVPTPIVGAISGADVGAGTSVAVAVNGRIAAVSPAYRSGPGWAYSALAPESAFRSGANAVAVYVVTGTPGRLTLHRVGGFPS